MNIEDFIARAFLDRGRFLRYYDLLNSFFLLDRIGAIHDAKTISVVIACAQLNQMFGFGYPVLYDAVKGIFGAQGHLRLSGLVDISGYEVFIKCVEGIRSEFEVDQEIETPRFMVEQKPITYNERCR